MMAGYYFNEPRHAKKRRDLQHCQEVVPLYPQVYSSLAMKPTAQLG